jgi:dCTP deaminase
MGNIARIPVAIYPNMRICALSFEYLSTPAEVPYYNKKNAKYKNQKGATTSRIDKE